MSIPGERVGISLSTGRFELRFLDHFKEFPLLIEPIEKGRLLRVDGTISETFGPSKAIDSLDIRLRPLRISLEDQHVQYILSLLPFFPSSPKPPPPPAASPALTRIYVRRLHIDRTQIVLSVVSRTVIHTDCQNVEIDLSRIEVRDRELFRAALLTLIVDRYISDAIAAVPLIVASLSLIGCPLHIVREAIGGARAAWATARTGGGSVLVGLGRGSVNLLRGITTGSLESLVRLANSLDGTITALLDRGEEARGVGRGLLEMVALPVSALLTVVKRTGGLVLRKVGAPAEREGGEVVEKKELVLLDLAELADEYRSE
jgi:hypothetical protein